MSDFILHAFVDRASCCQRLAADLGAALGQRLRQQERAALLLPGGNSPQLLLPLLAAQSLEWPRIDVSPSDERWVASDAAESNYRQLREGLLLANCLDPRQDASVQLAAKRWQAQLQAWLPFAAVLLGMGEDGHFASLFPGMPGLIEALDEASAPAVLPALAPSEPRQRLSPNLAMLCRTQWLGLLIFGADKRHLLESCAGLPVHTLLHNRQLPVQVYWAP